MPQFPLPSSGSELSGIHFTGVRAQLTLSTAASRIRAPGDLWLCPLRLLPHGLGEVAGQGLAGTMRL